MLEVLSAGMRIVPSEFPASSRDGGAEVPAREVPVDPRARPAKRPAGLWTLTWINPANPGLDRADCATVSVGPDASSRLEQTVGHWPRCAGTGIAVPDDISFAIYRRVTRSVNTLMLIDGFR
jgi:hypothetical protein